MTDEEKKPYHTIMVAAWRIFIKDRKTERFTGQWWEEIIADYDKLREPYKMTKYDLYCCHVSQAFLDELERMGKKYGAQKDIQAELPLAKAVPELAGNKENTYQYSAKDW